MLNLNKQVFIFMEEMMQVLKECIRERIEASAIRLFREHGFEKVSMRRIAKDSHMTVGNIYRYYKNKDHLFESLVMPTFEKIKCLVNDEMVKEFINTPEKNAAFVRSIIDIFLVIHRENEEILDILINSCKGSRIENPAKLISEMLAKRMELLLHAYNSTVPYDLDTVFLAKTLCASLVQNFIDILYEFEDDDSRRLHMYHVTQVYTNIFIAKIVGDRKEG